MAYLSKKVLQNHIYNFLNISKEVIIIISKKGLCFFIVLNFGLTISIITSAKLIGFTLVGVPAIMSQMIILISMFIPALSAILAQKAVLKKPLKNLGFKIGPWSMYLKTYSIILLIFVMNYAFTAIFITKPDWTLNSFLKQFELLTNTMTLPMPAPGMITLMAIITFFAAPIFNLIPSLGEEIGWRGFLLPNLEPLGKTKALIYSGIIWALWHTPMILILGFAYGDQAWQGVFLHFITVTGLGIWMGYIWFETRSTILAAFIHAVFNANAYGVWTLLFVSENKLIIGATGLIGATLCLILGIITLYIEKRKINS